MAAGQPLALPVLDIPVADGCLELVTVESGQSPPTWSFESYPLDALPGGFEIGRLYDGRPAGDWKIREYPDALSAPHVLAQLPDKGAEHAYKGGACGRLGVDRL